MFENSTIHIIAQAKNIQIVVTLRSLTAINIVSYIHRRTSMKLPDIQGKIIAQIAIAPQINIHHHVEVIERGVLTGFVIIKAIIQNMIKHKIVTRFHFTFLHKNIADININHMKNDQINIG